MEPLIVLVVLAAYTNIAFGFASEMRRWKGMSAFSAFIAGVMWPAMVWAKWGRDAARRF